MNPEIRFCKELLLLTLLFCGQQANAGLKFSSRESTIKLKDSNSMLKLETPISSFSGTLKIDSKTNNSLQGATASDKITFTEGVVAAGANKFILSGVYNPTTTDTIELGANHTLEVATGTIAQAVVINGTTGADSIITGQPLFSSDLVITSSLNFLKIGIQNKLSKNITLNGGTVTLTDDLALQDGIKLVGDGIIDINNYTLSLDNTSGAAWTGTLTLKNARDVQLTGFTQLSGEWIFNDVSGTSHLNGNGSILDLSGGGTITVAQGHTLYMSDVIIKGLGAGFGTLNINATGGIIKMSNVTLELKANYAHDSGVIYIQGDNCRVISAATAGGNYTFDVSGTGTKITVDHAVLEYETLEEQNLSPFTFTDAGNQKNLINGGTLRSAVLDTAQGDIVFDSLAPTGTLSANYNLTSQSLLLFTNSVTGAQNITLDGQGYYLQFPDGATGLLQIANDLTITLENVILKDFNPAVVTYGTSASLKFGDGVIVELGRDATLNGASAAWSFTGNATLDGFGHTVILTASSNRITVTGAKTLKIQNTKLLIDQASALSCLTYDAKIALQDCDLCVDKNNYTFALGSIDVGGLTRFRGCDSTNPGGAPLFTFSTTGTLTVQRAATLALLGDLEFKYQATPLPGATPSAATLAASKRHLKLNDPSSTLLLNCSTLTSTTTGLALDYGNLIVEDKVIFNIDSTSGSEAEFGTALDLNIKSGAILEVGGPLKYISTTYP